MTEPSLVECFVRPLVASELQFFITGGVATILYGEPRFTRDIDLVLAIRPSDADRFLSLWPEAEYYAPPAEAFVAESSRLRHGHFNVAHIESGLVADCYVAGDDPLHLWAFERVVHFDLEGLRVPVAPIEYVIARKLSYFAQSGSTRHLEDIARMLRVQSDAVDHGALQHWIAALHLEEPWRQVDLSRHN